MICLFYSGTFSFYIFYSHVALKYTSLKKENTSIISLRQTYLDIDNMNISREVFACFKSFFTVLQFSGMGKIGYPSDNESKSFLFCSLKSSLIEREILIFTKEMLFSFTQKIFNYIDSSKLL